MEYSVPVLQYCKLRMLQIAIGGRTAAVGHGAVLCGGLLATAACAAPPPHPCGPTSVPRCSLRPSRPQCSFCWAGGQAAAGTCKQSAKRECKAWQLAGGGKIFSLPANPSLLESLYFSDLCSGTQDCVLRALYHQSGKIEKARSVRLRGVPSRSLAVSSGAVSDVSPL